MNVGPIGIDFGTSYSKLAFCNEQGVPLSILDLGVRDRSDLFPAVLAVNSEGNILRGWPAFEIKQKMPRSSISFIKKLIGEGRTADFKMGEISLSPTDSLKLLFEELRERACQHLSLDVKDTVLTLPNSFDENKRNIFSSAASAAGWNPVLCLQDAEALAVSFLTKKSQPGKTVFYHLGGSFLVLVVVQYEGENYQILHTLTRSGIGGEDMNRLMTLRLKREVEDQARQMLAREDSLLASLWEESEKAKCALSHRGNYDVRIEDQQRGIQFLRALSRFELTDILNEMMQESMGMCEKLLYEAGLQKDQIQRVVFSGGAARMPMIQERIETFFKLKPEPALSMDHSLALGAALAGWKAAGKS